MSKIVVADKFGRTDSAYHSFNGNVNTNVPIVIVSWVEDFIFNDELLGIKDFVLICFCEYGWSYKIKDSNIWGTDNALNEQYSGEEWIKFNNWVKENPFKILFKRELLKKDISDKIKPLEYPCVIDVEYPIQPEPEFNNRPINVFQFWGRSNEERLRIHSEIWLHAYKKGFQPCDNIYYYNNYMHFEKDSEKWLTFWIPHWARIDVNELLKINGCSKLSLSWAGAGFKCFRTAEAPLNSIMVMHKNEYAWSYDWNETNCILVEPNKEIEGIEEALKRKDLYEVYLRGVENANNYKLNNYISNYIEPLINNLWK